MKVTTVAREVVLEKSDKQKKMDKYNGLWKTLKATPRTKMLSIVPERGETISGIFAALWYRAKMDKRVIGCTQRGQTLYVFNVDKK